eukprot:TRINITY_DN26093_c0_g1_i1.p1 TRINITY_DN26093_c0_g1~~TRINITY_DN26093_c0_g1_i1.p1  ORF type:complete len:418 (+),score=71.80 TRINITY_DN26093_c0_g1_i1:140-1393(+)
MLRSLVGSEMCIRDRYQRRVRGLFSQIMVKSRMEMVGVGSMYTVLLLLLLRRLKINWRWLVGAWHTLRVCLEQGTKRREVRVEEVESPDGERAIVWWQRQEEAPRESQDGVEDVAEAAHVWVILPGGMQSGDMPYMWHALDSGVLDKNPSHTRSTWCLFHNPGVVNTLRSRGIVGLTETCYLEHFIQQLLGRGCEVSLMGFSAGSMLAIAMAKQAEHAGLDVSHVVAIHGPDSIRLAFESHSRWWCRPDRFFSFVAMRTILKAGSPRFLPEDRGGGLHRHWMPWTQGWPWMRKYVEQVFGRPWEEIEGDLWSCADDMAQPLKIPVLRILSLNDPVISFEDCVDPLLFRNLDRVLVTPGGGHCAPFLDKELVFTAVSYTHLRAHETPEHLVCRLLLEKKKIGCDTCPVPEGSWIGLAQ